MKVMVRSITALRTPWKQPLEMIIQRSSPCRRSHRTRRSGRRGIETGLQGNLSHMAATRIKRRPHNWCQTMSCTVRVEGQPCRARRCSETALVQAGLSRSDNNPPPGRDDVVGISVRPVEAATSHRRLSSQHIIMNAPAPCIGRPPALRDLPCHVLMSFIIKVCPFGDPSRRPVSIGCCQ